MKQLLTMFSLFCATALSAQNNLTLRYDRPATYFEETLVLGNGNLGAIVYGGVSEEKVSLNDITLWCGEPETSVTTPDAYKAIPEIREALFREDYRTANTLQKRVQGHYSNNYEPLGQLSMTRTDAADMQNYSRTLDISKAIANVSYSTGSAKFSRNYFVSAPDSVIIIQMKAENGGKINRRFNYHCQLPHETFAEGNELQIDGYCAYYSLPGYLDGPRVDHFKYDSNRGVHFRTIVHIINKDGSLTKTNTDELLLTDCTEATIIISNVTSFNGCEKDPVREGRDYKNLVRARIDAAAKKTYEELYTRHEADYTPLFNRVNLDLGTTSADIASKTTDRQLWDYTLNKEQNPDLEELYFQYGRYLLISSSRTPGVPANLQGLWNEKILPPWSSNYTSNINVEENYWPSEIANLPEMHQSMLTWIQKLPLSGNQTAKAYYGVNEGWCLAHNTDIWAMTNPVGLHGDDPSWACWNMGGAWVSTHLWEHYLFTLDKDFLRQAYPALKGAADFCLGWMIEKDGHLITAPSTSPENIYKSPDGFEGSTLYGGFADIAMIKECLLDTRQAAIALGEDKAYIARLDDALKRILPYRIGKKGNLQEWYYDWEDQDPTHRHQSHLFGLFPGHHITKAQTPELAAACKRTLEIKGDKTTGWSTGWRINLQARLREPEAAYHLYRTLLNYITPDGYKGPDRRRGGGTYPNLLDAHTPFQIDGNFGGCAGVIEMLAQSTYEVGKTPELTLLPALPEAWSKQGSISGIRCRGGYEASFQWKNGKITSLQLKSVSGKPVTVLVSMPGQKAKKIKTK